MEEKIVEPIYRKIALDIAGRIYNGEFKEGDRIHGRSTLASEYNVSPETIRRAIILLGDMDVVSVTQGSGIFIQSRANAYKFIERYKGHETIVTMKSQLRKLFEEKQKTDTEMKALIDKIVDYSSRLKYVNIVYPVEFEVPKGSYLDGLNLSESKFWQNTGGTIVGIKRNGSLTVSPGPYAEFEGGDVILVVGDAEVLERINKFLEENKQTED